MIINGQDVGKQLITANGKWDATKRYKRLCIVYKDGCSYLSKSAVPAGTPVTDEDYWQKFFETDAALLIDLSDYKTQLREEIESLKTAVTALVNGNNEEVTKTLAETVATCTALEGNVNSHLNKVLNDVSVLTASLNSEQERLKKAIVAANKKTEDANAEATAKMAVYATSLQGVLTTEVERLENKLASVQDTVSVNLASQVATLSVVEPVDNSGATRLIVETDADRDDFTTDTIKVGYEVYVIETGLTYVLESIVLGTNVKTWKLQFHSTIGACYFDEFETDYDEITVDRAIADEEGVNISDNYVRKSDIAAYVDEIMKTKFVENMPAIYDGSITVDMLSQEVKDLFGAQCITNQADGFTIQNNGDGTIGLADHFVNVNNFRSYGHKHLKSNIADGINLLEQIMFEDDYTIYYVYLDYDLNGQTIEVPEHTVLMWCGGSFDNGTIKVAGGSLDEKFVGTNLTVEDL